jgi:hypothetical protein
MDNVTTKQLLKFNKKIFSLDSLSTKLIRNIPKLKIIKTINVTKNEYDCNIIKNKRDDRKKYKYIFEISDNAISNVKINSEYIKKYSIMTGHDILYNENCDLYNNVITQKNFQIIPGTK